MMARDHDLEVDGLCGKSEFDRDVLVPAPAHRGAKVLAEAGSGEFSILGGTSHDKMTFCAVIQSSWCEYFMGKQCRLAISHLNCYWL